LSRVDRATFVRRLGIALAVAGSGAPSALAADGGDYHEHPGFKFAFLAGLTTSPRFVPLQYGAQDACALVGCSSTWGGSAEADADALAKAVETAVAGGADGIALTLIDPQALERAVERAEGAHVPVVSFGSDLAWAAGSRRVAYVGVDPHALGVELAARIARLVPRGDVALLAGSHELAALGPIARSVVRSLERQRSAVRPHVVSTGADVYAQLSSVSRYAAAHPDVRGLFALDEGSTQGLVQALQKLPLRKAGVRAGAFGVLPEVLTLIDDGGLDFTVDEQPYLQGFVAAMQLFLAKLSGGLVQPCDLHAHAVFVTKANLQPYRSTRTRFEGSSSKQKYPIS